MMRIDESRIGTGGGQPGQTARTGETRAHSLEPPGDSFGRADRVSVSDLAGRLAEALGAGSEERQARIARLTMQFDSGALDADPARLSRALVSSMLPS